MSDENGNRLHLTLPDDLLKRVETRSEGKHQKKTLVIRQAIRAGLDLMDFLDDQDIEVVIRETSKDGEVKEKVLFAIF